MLESKIIYFCLRSNFRERTTLRLMNHIFRGKNRFGIIQNVNKRWKAVLNDSIGEFKKKIIVQVILFQMWLKKAIFELLG